MSPDVSSRDRVATESLERGGVDSLQWYEMSPEADSPHSALRRPVVHESAFKQATGEAVYTSDMAPRQGTFFILPNVCLCLYACVGLSVPPLIFKLATRETIYPSNMTRGRVRVLLVCFLVICVSVFARVRWPVCPPDMAPRQSRDPVGVFSVRLCVCLCTCALVCLSSSQPSNRPRKRPPAPTKWP